ncbi:capsular biosynthesis protein [Falsiroseomonas selenitidurans]|uniref:Capsular biosynthesis protein n=1 Tax=Falsiroseomonas selenitidurans TaxID=2716335 RepID=A0ABX1EBE4_9PROT|nr:capsular biosynthesis protein [Falsiroseomonas selenitidurans]NKC34516.1 capsular biosynthesis protein [Falsiroseomonas selenitidurans]
MSGPVPAPNGAPHRRRFLFLQGPISPVFAEIAAGLVARGHVVHRINLSLGDRLFWRRVPGAEKPVDYRGRPADWPAFVTAYLARHGITDLLLLGEQRDYHRAAIRAAHRAGAQVFVTDFGYFRPDWVTLERDGMGGDSHFPREPATIRALAARLPPADLTERYRDDFALQAAWDVAYHLANLAPWPFRHYRSHQLHHPVSTYLGIARRLLRRRAEHAEGDRALDAIGEAPFWLFAMQMETDFSVRAYSPYPDLDTPIAEVLDSFAREAPPEAHLLVKVHPLDPCVKHWPRRVRLMAQRAGVAERVHVAHHGRLDLMLHRARGLITINSTVGLRALALGRPSKALGQAVWDVPGLAHQGRLDDFWSQGRLPDLELRDAFLAALQGTTQLRGVFYGREGRAAAVAGIVAALEAGGVAATLFQPAAVPATP